jgi:hypothetical protein
MKRVMINGRLNPGKLKSDASKFSNPDEIKNANIIKKKIINIIKGVSSKKYAAAAENKIPLKP